MKWRHSSGCRPVARAVGGMQRHDVEAIEQILAKQPVADSLLQVAMGGGDDA